MHVLGIDPGFTSGGLVLLDVFEGDVVTVFSIAGKMDINEPVVKVGNGSYARDIITARTQAQRTCDAVRRIHEKHGVDHVAIESFVDFKSKARKEKQGLLQQRWKTPLMMGALDTLLVDIGFDTARGNVSWQNPAILDQFKTEIGQLKDKATDSELIATGANQITNDHLRKAWAHAEWCRMRIA